MDSPRAYLDTNVLKFSATALSRLVPRQQTINWGGLVQEVTVHDIKLVNPNETITDETLRRETELLPRLAQLGKLQKLRFAMQVEAEFESLGLRNMDSQTGRFYGAPIERVDAPVSMVV